MKTDRFITQSQHYLVRLEVIALTPNHAILELGQIVLKLKTPNQDC